MAWLTFLSALAGWSYSLAWSASFYPQPLLNLGRRSTSGTTVDFPFLNTLGFAAYLASNSALYYSPLIRRQYAARHRGLAPTVRFNDISFALHALVLSLVSLSQYLFPALWAFLPSPAARPSRPIFSIAIACLASVLLTSLLVVASPLSAPDRWCELDIVYVLGYVKLVVTLVKYTPQLIVNYRNKSTEGWSIWQILLDLTGGVLSIVQQSIDSYLQGDWSGISGNPVKFALGNVSIAYDLLFIIQHYLLYRHALHQEPLTTVDEPLLGPDNEEDDNPEAGSQT